jgi:HEAT repeat protein
MFNNLINLLAIQHNLSALESKDETVRRQAAIQLGKLRSKRATKPLLHLLRTDPDDVTRRWVQEALIQSADWHIVPELINDLKTPQSGVTRYHAATIIGALADQLYAHPLEYEEALHALHSILKNEQNPRGLRAYAATALISFKDTRTLEPLIKAIEAAPPHKSTYCAELVNALGEIASKLADFRAITTLINVLKTPLNDLKDYELCQVAARALAKFNLNFAFLPEVTELDVLIFFFFTGNEKQHEYAYNRLGGGIQYAFNPADLAEIAKNLGEEDFHRAQTFIQLHHQMLTTRTQVQAKEWLTP